MKKSLAALSALAAIAGSLPAGVQIVSTESVANASSGVREKLQTGEARRVAVGDTKAHRLGTGGYVRRRRAPVGKRYSASVRQHQRHAAKARNVRRSKR